MSIITGTIMYTQTQERPGERGRDWSGSRSPRSRWFPESALKGMRPRLVSGQGDRGHCPYMSKQKPLSSVLPYLVNVGISLADTALVTFLLVTVLLG